MLQCKSQVGGLAMSSLTVEQRRAVARRLFAALCSYYPNHYVALFEQPGPNPTATTEHMESAAPLPHVRARESDQFRS
jgi:hypothetical protein